MLRRVEAELVAQVRQRLGADRFDQAFSAGSGLTQQRGGSHRPGPARHRHPDALSHYTQIAANCASRQMQSRAGDVAQAASPVFVNHHASRRQVVQQRIVGLAEPEDDAVGGCRQRVSPSSVSTTTIVRSGFGWYRNRSSSAAHAGLGQTAKGHGRSRHASIPPG